VSLKVLRGKAGISQFLFALSLSFSALNGGGVAIARPNDHAESKKQKTETPAPPAGPLFFVISTSKQHVSVYGNDGLYARSPVSTGRPDHPTPLGLFTIIGKERFHRSNLYSGAPMPFMQRLTDSGVAMHEGVLPGYAASHGCVRMPHDFAQRLFGITQGNEHVVIARQDIVPSPISHQRLPVPTFMAMPGTGNIASGSAQMLQNAIATAQNPAPLPVAVTPDASEAKPAAQKLLNPLEFAKAMKVYAAKRAEAASAAISGARANAEAKAREAREAVFAVRKAEIALNYAKDRLENAESQLKKVSSSNEVITAELAKAEAEEKAAENQQKDASGDEAVKAAEAAKAKAEEKVTDSQRKKASGDAAVKTAEAAKAEAEDKVKAAQLTLASAMEAKTAKEQAAQYAAKAIGEIGIERKAASDAVKTWERRVAPLSVFISRKTQRLYIRQDHMKVFDVPVTIRDPQKPLGTHLYIALRPDQSAQAQEQSLRWVVLSVPEGSDAANDDGRRRRHHFDDDDAPRAAGPAPSASEALDRIEIPAEVEKKISEMIWAGGSLLISDRGMSGETGAYTDFVILTR